MAMAFVNMEAVYRVSKTATFFVGEECTNPRTSPAIDREYERNLHFVAWVDEVIFVDSPEGMHEVLRFFRIKIILVLLFIRHLPFLGKRSSDPLDQISDCNNGKRMDSRYRHLTGLLGPRGFQSLWQNQRRTIQQHKLRCQ